ncbi:amidohydrolase [Spirosoma daeguense]
MAIESMTDFIQFRQELHRFPERSGQEFQTRERIKNVVRQFNPIRIDDIAETGLLLQYGDDVAGPVTLLRADMDALPILETNTFAYKSANPGVSHKCGHDGHTTILVRLASLLAQKSDLKGRVYLLFQPAEETGQGAQAVLNDPVFATLRPNQAFALHNLPGFPKGAIICKAGSFTASVQSLIVTFRGKTSHAAEPENGINPAYAMAEFLLRSQQFELPDTKSEKFVLITPVHSVLGQKDYGTSAGYGEVHLTLRTWTAQRMDALVNDLMALLSDICQQSNIETETAFTEVFYANENHPEAVAQIQQATSKLGYDYIETQAPFKFGEDFGLFTQKFPGAMFGIGAGENTPALHNDDYDFDDTLIEPAAQFFLELLAICHL